MRWDCFAAAAGRLSGGPVVSQLVPAPMETRIFTTTVRGICQDQVPLPLVRITVGEARKAANQSSGDFQCFFFSGHLKVVIIWVVKKFPVVTSRRHSTHQYHRSACGHNDDPKHGWRTILQTPVRYSPSPYRSLAGTICAVPLGVRVRTVPAGLVPVPVFWKPPTGQVSDGPPPIPSG